MKTLKEPVFKLNDATFFLASHNKEFQRACADITADDLIITEKLPGVDVNDKIRLNRVLLLGSTTETVIGRPTVEGASVIAAVEEQFLDGKVLVFKKRRRKNSRRLNGHRQPLTSLRVLDVLGDVNV